MKKKKEKEITACLLIDVRIPVRIDISAWPKSRKKQLEMIDAQLQTAEVQAEVRKEAGAAVERGRLQASAIHDEDSDRSLESTLWEKFTENEGTREFWTEEGDRVELEP